MAELDGLRAQGRFAVFFGFQNASPIEDNVDYLDIFYRLGIRFIQLTYNARNLVAPVGRGSPGDPPQELRARTMVAARAIGRRGMRREIIRQV